MQTINQLISLLKTVNDAFENQTELVFDNESSNISSTQEHILMLLLNDPNLSNKELVNQLKVSAPAVTRALKILQKEQLITPAVECTSDKRVKNWQLTNKGSLLAKQHHQKHEYTNSCYENLLAQFNDNEQEVISRFLTALQTTLAKENQKKNGNTHNEK